MRSQPIKNKGKNTPSKTKTNSGVRHNWKKKAKRVHKKDYGTSKLEVDFAREFLDKLELKYIYQYNAKDIGRYFDFAIPQYQDVPFLTESKDGIECVKQEGQNVPISFIIEIDGGYYHSDPRVVKEDKLSPMQKHNKVIDFIKTRWCGLHGYPLLRIWEYDIRKNPNAVMDELLKYLVDGDKRRKILENKKRPH